MLSRKYYTKFAEVINKITDDSIRKSVAKEFAGVLKADNPNFKHSTWFNACNVEID